MFFRKDVKDVPVKQVDFNQELLDAFIEQVQKPYLKFTSDRKLTMYLQIKSNQEILDECKEHLDNFFQLQRELYFQINNTMGNVLFAMCALIADALHNFPDHILYLDFDSLRAELPKFWFLKAMLLKYIDNNLAHHKEYDLVKNKFYKL
ncbi:hypothetical protein [Priestia megaterium]|uniref:hypothetical protein n=1 Tax=Priestia megaterium TaxID=1404 RepID=UPI001867AE90|nr:hypothetical protein [Priestia megaterium]MBE2977786.1 hypothetical protein [Priestia megaterium]